MQIIKIFDFVEKRSSNNFNALAGCRIARNYLEPVIEAIEQCRQEDKPMDSLLQKSFSHALIYPANENFPEEIHATMRLMGRLFSKKYGHMACDAN